MNKIILFLLTICLSTVGSAQNNLYIFSENGKPFSLFLNDTKMNTLAESSVKCENLRNTKYVVSLMINDTLVVEKFEVFLTWKADSVKNKDFTYILTQDKNHYELEFLRINESTSDSLSIDARVKEMLDEILLQTQIKNSIEAENNFTHLNEKGECILALDEKEFMKAKSKLKLERFEEPKERYLMKLIARNCVTNLQLEEFLDLLNYEITRLQMVKFALPYLIDRPNVETIKKHFHFDAAQKEVERYIKTHKR